MKLAAGWKHLEKCPAQAKRVEHVSHLARGKPSLDSTSTARLSTLSLRWLVPRRKGRARLVVAEWPMDHKPSSPSPCSAAGSWFTLRLTTLSAGQANSVSNYTLTIFLLGGPTPVTHRKLRNLRGCGLFSGVQCSLQWHLFPLRFS